MKIRLAITSAAMIMAAAGPSVAGEASYRVTKVEGAAPVRVMHVINLDQKASASGKYDISYVDLFETPEKDGASRIFTGAHLDCKARTMQPWSVQRYADNMGQISDKDPKGPARPIKPGSNEDLYRAAVCDGMKDGLTPFKKYDVSRRIANLFFDALDALAR